MERLPPNPAVVLLTLADESGTWLVSSAPDCGLLAWSDRCHINNAPKDVEGVPPDSVTQVPALVSGVLCGLVRDGELAPIPGFSFRRAAPDYHGFV